MNLKDELFLAARGHIFLKVLIEIIFRNARLYIKSLNN
jgi:hypothetical protein